MSGYDTPALVMRPRRPKDATGQHLASDDGLVVKGEREKGGKRVWQLAGRREKEQGGCLVVFGR